MEITAEFYSVSRPVTFFRIGVKAMLDATVDRELARARPRRTRPRLCALGAEPPADAAPTTARGEACTVEGLRWAVPN
jgi:hypothetical protein